MSIQMVPGQGFYKGNDYQKKQQIYLTQKEKEFQLDIKKKKILPLNIIISNIQKKISKHITLKEIKVLSSNVSEYFHYKPTELENNQLKKL